MLSLGLRPTSTIDGLAFDFWRRMGHGWAALVDPWCGVWRGLSGPVTQSPGVTWFLMAGVGMASCRVFWVGEHAVR